MHGYGMGWGMGWGMMVVRIVIPLVLGAILAWAMATRSAGTSRDGARQVLRERYARGEIDGDTLQRMLAELGGQGTPGGAPSRITVERSLSE